MGALTYKPEIVEEGLAEFKVELDEIAKATNQIITGAATNVLDELFKLGGSSGGARPKILVGYNPITQHLIGSDKTLPYDYEHWLIKFPSSSDRPDIPNISLDSRYLYLPSQPSPGAASPVSGSAMWGSSSLMRTSMA